MKITEVPFVQKMGIRTGVRPYELVLPFDPDYANHLGLWFAGIEFSLAEAASGHFLIEHFPDLAGQVIPMLRDARIRFRKPSQATLHALPEVSDEEMAAFEDQMTRKGRAKILVDVRVREDDDSLVAEAGYEWFVQRIEDDSNDQ
jgi:acyl-coenzyme A thioesterase PaaI-like protein